jgi:hypothetical protein
LKKLRVILLLPLMLLGAFLVPIPAHAATGVVSVNGGALVTAPSSATTVSVPIRISGSDNLNGFDIQVYANINFTDAASVSLASSILGTGSAIVLECIDGVLIAGTTCSATDGIGVVHLAATEALGAPTVPGNGLLFTINYNIRGLTPGTPITFQKGCTGTSVSSGACVTVANGGAVPLSETVLPGSFANQIDFTIATKFPKYSTPASTSIGVGISYASLGGYQDILTESYAVSPVGPTCTFASGASGVDLTVSKTGSDTLNCSGPTGSYSVTVTATGQGIFTPPQPLLKHSTTFPLAITPADFSVSLSQSSVTVSFGTSDPSTTIKVAGVSGFGGVVSFTASSASGITGSAPTATLTNDGSGYSTGSSTLTVSVGSAVATGSYTLTVTGMSGATSHSATLTVVVPSSDFSVFAVPNSISAVRGGTVALVLNINSLGSLSGAATFTATVQPVPGQQDSAGLTNNITPAFAPATATLAAGGSLAIQFFASTIGGDAAISAGTATKTGNYTSTITATIGGVTHSVPVKFNVEDFSVGPGFCSGNNFVQTSPDSYDATIFTNTTLTGGDIAGQTIGTPCNSLTITDQPNLIFPYLSIFSSPAQILYVQTNALGGYVTDGFNGLPSVSAVNFALPGRGIKVPQLASILGPKVPAKACMVATFWPNGTQIPYAYLAANGPLILPDSGLFPFLGVIDPAHFAGVSNWGCRFDNAAYPRDVGNQPELNSFMNGFGKGTGNFGLCFPNFGPSTPCDYQNVNNPDFWGVTAMALQGTLPGDYTFQQCANNGAVQHCQTFGLTVVNATILHQLVVRKSISFSASGGSIPFKIGVTNPSLTHTVFAIVSVTGIGSFGDTFSATSGLLTISPNANVNNVALSARITASEIGETFTFSFSIAVGTDSNNLDGTSTEQSIQQTITITA